MSASDANTASRPAWASLRSSAAKRRSARHPRPAYSDRELGKETHIGEVALSIAPRERGSGNQIRFAIDTAILPAAFVDAVRQGVENALQSDPVTGYPLQDADVEITAMPRRDGSTVAGYHMAAGIALRSALEAAQVTTLEPLMFVEISAPEANLGPAISLFGTRGGKVENILDHAGLKLVQGLAPLSKLFGPFFMHKQMPYSRQTS